MKTHTSDALSLFERGFKSHAEYHSDELPKKDAANAKRVATALKTAAGNYRFESLMEPEQLLALKAATNVLIDLARTLDEVCVLSKRHFKKCEADRKVKAAQHKAAREAVLDAAAAARWSDDVQMLVDAEELAVFLKDGGAWLEQRRGGDCRYIMQPQIDAGNDSDDSHFSYHLARLTGACKAQPAAAASLALRRYAAAVVDALMTESRASYFYSGSHWHYPRLVDFEAWRTDRADRRRVVALATGSVV